MNMLMQALKLLSETLQLNGLPQLAGITSGASDPAAGASSSGGFLSGSLHAKGVCHVFRKKIKGGK